MLRPSIRTCLVVILLILAAERSFAARTETWTEVRSPNFLVLTDSSEKQGRNVVLQFELIRAVFRQFFNIPGAAKDPVVTIIAIKNEDGLKRLMPGFWASKGLLSSESSLPAGLYLAGPEKDHIALRLDEITDQEAREALGRRADDPFENVHHGYVHFLAGRLLSQLPLWLVEGSAEFFGSTEVKGRKISVGAPSRTNLEVLQGTKLLPLGTLFAVDASSPYYHEENRNSIFYAQSWLLTHYLITRDWREGTHRVTDFVALLGQSVEPEEAARRTIGDPLRLQKELKRYLDRSLYSASDLPMPLSLDANAFTAEPASPAESLAVRAEFVFAAEYAATMAKARDGRRDAAARPAMAQLQQKHQEKMKESETSAHPDDSERPELELTPNMAEATIEKGARDTQGGKMAVLSKAVEVPSPTASPAAPPVLPSGTAVGSGSKGGEVAALSKTTEIPSRTAPPLASKLVAPADELFFEAYRRSDPITKWPLNKMLHQIPELKGLKPATDQSQLPEVLRGVSENLQKFVTDFVNITALETIEEAQRGGGS
jgi:hypothetical protein